MHEYVEEVNHAIELYNFCKEFHVLPRAGGLYEQDALDMLLLRFVSDAVAEKTKNDTSKGKGAR